MGTPLPIEFASLGMADSLILMVLALVVFGPRRLPQIGRQIGKLMYEFRKASNDFKFQMEEELRVSEDDDRRKKQEAERLSAMTLAAPAQTIEAQADIGAIETSTPSPYPGEGSYPPQYPPETPAENAAHVVTIPRIQPPTTGEPVSAMPAAFGDPADEVAEAHIGVEDESAKAHSETPIESASESIKNPPIEPASSGTETANQHG